MSLQRPILDISMEATAQIIAGNIVKLDALGRAVTTTAATDRPIGVVIGNNGATAPFQCTVRVQGIVQVLSDGAGSIAPGDQIGMSTTAGKAIKDASTLGTTNKKWLLGTAMNVVAATANLLVDVLLDIVLFPST